MKQTGKLDERERFARELFKHGIYVLECGGGVIPEPRHAIWHLRGRYGEDGLRQRCLDLLREGGDLLEGLDTTLAGVFYYLANDAVLDELIAMQRTRPQDELTAAICRRLNRPLPDGIAPAREDYESVMFGQECDPPTWEYRLLLIPLGVLAMLIYLFTKLSELMERWAARRAKKLVLFAVVSSMVASHTGGQNIPLQVDGLCYSPFRDGQSPATGIYPARDEMRTDLRQWHGAVRQIRSYSATRTQALIPILARKQRLQCFAGAWVSADPVGNQTEITQLLAIVETARPSALIVGSEVLLHGDLTDAELISLIQQVKSQTRLPVGCDDTWSQWLGHPEVAAVADVLLVNVHPYWESIPVENAAAYVYQRWQDVKNQYPDKPVIIGETGWPTAGPSQGDAVPSEDNQCRFLRDWVTLATTHSVPYFVFEAFDEAWKRDATGLEVETHWGLATSARQTKLCVASVFAGPPTLIETLQSATCGAVDWSRQKLIGRVYGLPASALKQYRVVVYAQTDNWYVQPLGTKPLTKLRRNGRWKARTHLGSGYAALLVNQSYLPSPLLYALPDAGDDVLAINRIECLPCPHRAVCGRSDRTITTNSNRRYDATID